MDHPVSLPEAARWRTTALVAAALAAFELILLVIIVLALIARPLVGGGSESAPRAAAPAPAAKAAAPKTAPAKTPPAAPAAAPAKPKLDRNETLVIVLNGNGSQGAASEKADLVRTKGYMIAGTANAPRSDFERSVVMFRPGYRGEAVRLGEDFGVNRVSPLDGLGARDLQGAHVALIVGLE